eukprot:1134397-Pelagomonas_calceolata.AAC.1
MEVKTAGGGGLFNPSAPLHTNAHVLLGCLHEVMHDSHQRLPCGVLEKDFCTTGYGNGDGIWQWQRPWKKREMCGEVHENESLSGGSVRSSARISGIVDCSVNREDDGAGSSMGEGDGCQWSDWVCSDYSKHKVESTGNKLYRSFNNHKKGGYLKVLLGYSHHKHRAVYKFAHRIVLWAFCGPPLQNGGPHLITLHACDRPTCLCVAHLSWGTSRDNNHHVVKKQKQELHSVRRQLNFGVIV